LVERCAADPHPDPRPPNLAPPDPGMTRTNSTARLLRAPA
jgi:hypothetical protein